jgi:hypothetical protein
MSHGCNDSFRNKSQFFIDFIDFIARAEVDKDNKSMKTVRLLSENAR